MKRKYFYPIILIGAFIFLIIIQPDKNVLQDPDGLGKELVAAFLDIATVIFVIITLIGFEIYKLIRKKIDSGLSEKEIEEDKKFKITKTSGFVILIIIATIIFLIKTITNF